MDEPVLEPDARTWGMLAHLLALLGYVTLLSSCWIPPLVVYLAKKDEHEFIAEQARESLNFQITVLLIGIACLPFVCVLVGIPMLMALCVYHVVFVIIAAIRANEGRRFRYPLTLRFVT